MPKSTVGDKYASVTLGFRTIRSVFFASLAVETLKHPQKEKSCTLASTKRVLQSADDYVMRHIVTPISSTIHSRSIWEHSCSLFFNGSTSRALSLCKQSQGSTREQRTAFGTGKRVAHYVPVCLKKTRFFCRNVGPLFFIHSTRGQRNVSAHSARASPAFLYAEA